MRAALTGKSMPVTQKDAEAKVAKSDAPLSRPGDDGAQGHARGIGGRARCVAVATGSRTELRAASLA